MAPVGLLLERATMADLDAGKRADHSRADEFLPLAGMKNGVLK